METTGYKTPNHSHAWRGAWNRPMKIDEDSLDAFTVARMTDHNVRGPDAEEDEPIVVVEEFEVVEWK
jgi:hypothetical protein